MADNAKFVTFLRNLQDMALDDVPQAIAAKIEELEQEQSPWIWPVKGIRPRITQKFNNPTVYGPHEGTDMDCYDETKDKLCEIMAVADGKVLAVNVWDGTKKGFQAYGHWVLVQHGEYTVRYCHLLRNSIRVTAEQTVEQGETLGTGDNSGNSIGSHLHLTVTHPDAPPSYIFGQRCVNPESLLPPV